MNVLLLMTPSDSCRGSCGVASAEGAPTLLQDDDCHDIHTDDDRRNDHEATMRREIPGGCYENRARHRVKDPDPVLNDPGERYPHQASQNPDRQGQRGVIDAEERNGDGVDEQGHRDAMEKQAVERVLRLSL